MRNSKQVQNELDCIKLNLAQPVLPNSIIFEAAERVIHFPTTNDARNVAMAYIAEHQYDNILIDDAWLKEITKIPGESEQWPYVITIFVNNVTGIPLKVLVNKDMFNAAAYSVHLDIDNNHMIIPYPFRFKSDLIHLLTALGFDI